MNTDLATFSDAIDKKDEDLAKSQLDSIKANLKYLEKNMIEENTKNGVTPRSDEKIISKFRKDIPNFEEVLKKLELRKDADPALECMVKDLNEAIDLEKL